MIVRQQLLHDQSGTTVMRKREKVVDRESHGILQ